MELRDRLAIALLLIPWALCAVALGGVLYLAGVVGVFLIAALEYTRLFHLGRQRPAVPLVLSGVALMIAAVQYPQLNPGGALLALAVLLPLAWHTVDFELGALTSGTDFVITVAGIFYLGGLGQYFISLRALPDGLWWLLATLTAIWLADTGAYIFGKLFGRHRMTPRLSPKKTWEGYAGSILFGAAGGGALSAVWAIGAGPGSLLNWQTGALVGGLVGLLGPVGDLGVSMLKRQIGVKDTGALLAGHGGALDRMDSWLVAVAIGYYYVLALQALTS